MLIIISRSDESGRLSFLRTRTLGDRIRDTRTWAKNRRSSSEKELTPKLEINGTREVSEPRDNDSVSGDTGQDVFGSQSKLQDSSMSSPSPGSRLSRIFSLRRSSDPPSVNERTHPDNSVMHPLAEEDETMLCPGGPMAAPPSLPPPPTLMSPDQTKRRFIINSLVQSENNYLESLNRLITDYKKPLEESNPPILSESKVSTMFHRVPEILQVHSQFRIALSDAIKNWDEVRQKKLLIKLSEINCLTVFFFQDEKIGDVFVASFSKSVVLEIYADFINNFSEAMDLAKCESKRKSAFGDFLKVGLSK